MDSSKNTQYALPGMIERLLGALAVQYEGAGDDVLRSIVVNARPVVDAGVSYDNWDGGISGHDLHLLVPRLTFAKTGKRLGEIQKQLKSDLALLVHCRGEFIEALTVELDEDTLGDWRQESGVLVRRVPIAVSLMATDVDRIWSPGFLRVFISHKAECKEQATSLKLALNRYGMSGFVAHCDIKPTREWQDEIERALQSMHAMVLLLTRDYHDSEWTDQETGVALGRDVPIVPVRIEIDPYGFVGKMQAVPGTGKSAAVLAREMLDLLLVSSIRDDLLTALVTRFEKSDNFAQANELMAIIDSLGALPPALVDRLEKAPAGDNQVENANAVKWRLPALLKRHRGA